jgi:hypothetical protein
MDRESAWKTFLRKISFSNKDKAERQQAPKPADDLELHVAQDEKIIRE